MVRLTSLHASIRSLSTYPAGGSRGPDGRSPHGLELTKKGCMVDRCLQWWHHCLLYQQQGKGVALRFPHWRWDFNSRYHDVLLIFGASFHFRFRVQEARFSFLPSPRRWGYLWSCGGEGRRGGVLVRTMVSRPWAPEDRRRSRRKHYLGRNALSQRRQGAEKKWFSEQALAMRAAKRKSAFFSAAVRSCGEGGWWWWFVQYPLPGLDTHTVFFLLGLWNTPPPPLPCLLRDISVTGRKRKKDNGTA